MLSRVRFVANRPFCTTTVQHAFARKADNASNKDAPEMPKCDFKPEKYKGASIEEATKSRKGHLFPGTHGFAYYKKSIMINQGHMQWLWDTAGKRYLDLFGGIVTVSVGHCHPKVLAAAEAQMKKLWHTTVIYMYPTLHEYVAKLASKMPGDLKMVYLVNSGSEANDLAMLLARLHTGCYDILGFRPVDCLSLVDGVSGYLRITFGHFSNSRIFKLGWTEDHFFGSAGEFQVLSTSYVMERKQDRSGYHGTSPNLLGLTALSTWHYNIPAGFGIHQTMNPDPYRGLWGGKYCRDSPCQTNRTCDCKSAKYCVAGDKYLDQLEDVLRFCCPKGRVGGIFAESIQGVGGTVQFPKNFLKRAFEVVRDHGGVCISDEVQTGFGRTGEHYWGFESHGVIPDIVTMAKGIGNGFPMAAVVTTPEIAKSLSAATHFNTFGGNPVACAVGSAVLDVIDEDKCQQKSADVGTYFIKELDKLREDFGIVGDVRGKGLMIGMEMVKDKASRKPLTAPEMADIWEVTKDMGVLIGKGGYYGNVFRIKPPMCISKEDVDYAVRVIRIALDKFTQK